MVHLVDLHAKEVLRLPAFRGSALLAAELGEERRDVGNLFPDLRKERRGSVRRREDDAVDARTQPGREPVGRRMGNCVGSAEDADLDQETIKLVKADAGESGVYGRCEDDVSCDVASHRLMRPERIENASAQGATLCQSHEASRLLTQSRGQRAFDDRRRGRALEIGMKTGARQSEKVALLQRIEGEGSGRHQSLLPRNERDGQPEEENPSHASEPTQVRHHSHTVEDDEESRNTTAETGILSRRKRGNGMPNEIVEMLCELVQVDSESGNERGFMEFLGPWLARRLGAVSELDAYGNLIARVPAKDSRAEPVMLGAHGDTVKPGRGIRPQVVDGAVRSSGDTILGADDKGGIVEIVRAVQTARRRPPVDIVITVSEEVGLLGARNLDLSKVRAKQAFIVDGEKLEEVIIGGPTHINFDITIRGRAAHAGLEPEKGISAIRVAALAIAQMPEGRIDFETTANVGIIEGGLIRNGVPETVKIKAECRSLTHEKALKQARAMREAFERAAADAGAKVEIDEEIEYQARSIDPSTPVVQAAMAAVRSVGLVPVAKPVTGGTDALILSNRGLEAVVLGLGGEKAHTTEEFIPVAALEKGAEILRNLLESLA